MSIPLKDVVIGQKFSFEVYPTGILGNDWKNVTLEGIISARAAMGLGEDIQSLHRNVYPSLPAGVPNDPFQYSYVRVQTASGQFLCLGVPWIRPDSITVASGGKLTLVFNDKSQADLDRILLALSANGYSPSSSTFE